MTKATQNGRKILNIEDEVPYEKLEVHEQGKVLKKEADQLFATDPQKALVTYHKVLLHWKGLNRNRQNPATPSSTGDSKPKSQLDEDLGKIYSNMSACYLKLRKWERTIETANQALALNKDNHKALFRKAKALGEQGFFEKAEPLFNELLTKNPAEAPAIKTELEAFRAKDKKRELKAKQKLKGFLNKADQIFDADTAPDLGGSSESSASAKIEEVKE